MVQFHFQFGRRRDGGFGVRSVPIYAIHDWSPTVRSDGSLLFRPSARTVLRRSAITLAAAALLVMLVWSNGLPWSPKQPLAPPPHQQGEIDAAARDLQRRLAQQLTEEQRRGFAEAADDARQAQQQRLAADRAELAWMHRVGRTVHWTLFQGLLALGVVPLILAAWERVDLRQGPDGDLIVRRRRFLTRERIWPRGSFGGILCVTVERIHRPARAWPQHLGWFWEVRLLPRDERGGLAAPQHVDDPLAEFHVARQPDRPLDENKPPKRVRTFLKHLVRLAEVDPQFVLFGIHPDPCISPRGFWSRRKPRVRTRTVEYSSEPVVESTTYTSLDEMPPEVRKIFQQMLQHGVPPEGVSQESFRVTIRDADGAERTYTSLDDMPPELRRRYEQVRRQSGRRQRRSQDQ